MASYDRKSQQSSTPTLAPQIVEEGPVEASYGNAAMAECLPAVEQEASLLDFCEEDTGIEVAFVGIDLPGTDGACEVLDTQETFVTHVYLRTEDGSWSAGFTMGDGLSPIDVYTPEPRAAEAPQGVVGTVRQADPESQAMSAEELQDAVKVNAATMDPGKYDALGNNCGDFVRKVLDASHLVSVMPHLSGAAGDLTAAQHPIVDAVAQGITDGVDWVGGLVQGDSLDGAERESLGQGADAASLRFSAA